MKATVECDLHIKDTQYKDNLVMKFGGTSLESDAQIMQAAQLIAMKAADFNVIVVVSARGRMTNNLMSQANSLYTKNSDKDKDEYDTVLAAGEQISAGLMSLALRNINIKAKSYLGWQIAIETDAHYGEGRISRIHIDKLEHSINNNEIPVLAGFQGVCDGRITTLGRGGSDITAVSIAAALNAKCEIYTDVKGVYTTDPKNNPNADIIPEISHEHLLEMSSAGAKVLHSRGAAIALHHNTAITILSAKDLAQHTKTITQNDAINDSEYNNTKNNIEAHFVTGIVNQKQITIIKISQFQQKLAILHLLHEHNIEIHSIKQMHSDELLLFFKEENIGPAINVLSQDTSVTFDIIRDYDIVSVIGSELKEDLHISIKIMKILASVNAQYLFFETADMRISFSINTRYSDIITQKLHDNLIKNSPLTL